MWRPAPPYPDNWHVLSVEIHIEEDDGLPLWTEIKGFVINEIEDRVSIFLATFWHEEEGLNLDGNWTYDPEYGCGLSFAELQKMADAAK